MIEHCFIRPRPPWRRYSERWPRPLQFHAPFTGLFFSHTYFEALGVHAVLCVLSGRSN